jgi:hypothetical protein
MESAQEQVDRMHVSSWFVAAIDHFVHGYTVIRCALDDALQRQHVQSCLTWFHADERTILYLCLSGLQCANNGAADKRGCKAVGTYLHHARFPVPGCGKNGAKIEIVRKHNESIGDSLFPQHFLGGVARATHRPTRGRNSRF